MVRQDMPSKKPKVTTLFTDSQIKSIANFMEKSSRWEVTMFHPTTQPVGPIGWNTSVIQVQFQGYERDYNRCVQAEDLLSPKMMKLSLTLITAEVVSLKEKESETLLGRILKNLGDELLKYDPGIGHNCDFANIHHRVFAQLALYRSFKNTP